MPANVVAKNSKITSKGSNPPTRESIVPSQNTDLYRPLTISQIASLTYYNWHQLWTKGEYSLKLAAFGPLGVVGGAFLLLFPTMGGKPNTTSDRFAVLAVFVLGIIAGLINWFLMDPGYFGM